MSTHDTVLFEAQVVHRLIDRLFNLLPVRTALDELIHILAWRKREQGGTQVSAAHIGTGDGEGVPRGDTRRHTASRHARSAPGPWRPRRQTRARAS